MYALCSDVPAYHSRRKSNRSTERTGYVRVGVVGYQSERFPDPVAKVAGFFVMPSTDPHYHAKWVAKRRAEFLEGKTCVKCGSSDYLEVDHIDPMTKVGTQFWSWRAERRLAELAKCQVLCRGCHRQKSHAFFSRLYSGAANTAGRRLSDEQVAEIRRMIADGVTERKIAAVIGISRPVVNAIRHGRAYAATLARKKTERPEFLRTWPSGTASPCQGENREFDPRRSLHRNVG